jgi:hypothetical protein
VISDQNSTGNILFTTGTTTTDSTKMTILGNGNVGIGASSPNAIFSISNNIYAAPLGSSYGQYQELLYDSGSASSSYGMGIEASNMGFNSGGGYKFYQNGGVTPLMVIGGAANTNVGIGTSAPASILNVTPAPVATNAVASVSIGEGGWTGGVAPDFVGNTNGTELGINSIGAYTGDLANFEVGGSSKFKVTSGGNVTTAGSITATRSIASTQSSVTNDPGTSFTVDFSQANVQVYSYDVAGNPGNVAVAVTLSNLTNGGAYTLVINNSANASTPTFSFSGCTTHYVPANGATTASTRTVYSILSTIEGGVNHCYISWIPGFN